MRFYNQQHSAYAGVDLHADRLVIVRLGFQIGFETAAKVHHCGFFFVRSKDRQDDDVRGSEARLEGSHRWVR